MDYFKDASSILVEKRKVIEYLLNSSHPDNTGKTKILIEYGFHPDNWELFTKSVITHAQKSNIVSKLKTPFGEKVILEGSLETPSGKKL